MQIACEASKRTNRFLRSIRRDGNDLERRAHVESCGAGVNGREMSSGLLPALLSFHRRSSRAYVREQGWREFITFLNGIAGWRHHCQVRSHPRTMFFYGLGSTNKQTATPLERGPRY